MGFDPNFLVTGAAGQVGRALAEIAPSARFLSRDELDVTNGEAVARAAEGAAAIVHLAAMTNVDRCEVDAETAFRINAEGTANVVRAAREHGAWVLYLSTDYVFSGEKDGEYEEDDPTGPLNVYGRSKLAGEEFVLKTQGNLVVRTSWVIGDGKNFIRTIVGAGRTRPSLQVVDDQWGRPTFASDLAEGILALLAARPGGVVHISGDGLRCTWADLAEEALRLAGLRTSVERIDSATYAAGAGKPVAVRPRNSVLCLDRAKRLGLPLSDWKASLEHYVKGLQ